MEEKLSVQKIHKAFVPHYDKLGGRLRPRIRSLALHFLEVGFLWLKGNRPYVKHGRQGVTCRQHAKVEFGDFLWHIAELVWMTTGIELKIVPKQNYTRVWNKLESYRKEYDQVYKKRNGKDIQL